MTRLILSVSGLMVLVLTAAVSVAVQLGERLPPAEEMAFVSRRQGDFEIYTLDIQRHITVNLTNTAFWRNARFTSQDQAPAWRPDGQKIAFHSNRNGSEDIYIMDADGRNVQRLTFGDGINMHPAWSPDGKWIAYQSLQGRDYEIYLLNVQQALRGEPPIRLTDNTGGDKHPAFSPDGTRIVFAYNGSSVFNTFQLYTMRRDGTEREALYVTEDDTNAQHPEYSPDGEYVIFDSFRENTTNSVFKIRANGRGLARRIAGDLNGPDAYFPTWTPDGQRVVFVSSRLGYSEIYTAPMIQAFEFGADSQLTFNPTMDIQPAMRPMPHPTPPLNPVTVLMHKLPQ